MMLYMLLGAHAQRGLQSACLLPRFLPTTRNNAPNKIYQQLRRDMSKVLKMLGSEVMASFAYRGSVRRCCSDPWLLFPTTEAS